MSLAVQGSLFDHAERRWLGDGAWVDVRAGWLTGADTLFDELLTAIPWLAEHGVEGIDVPTGGGPGCAF